jgi:phosphatidylserine/phosphatidylglycerophosphate/cardiolipin synthase-like enzyme
MQENIVFAFCGLTFFIVALSSAFAGEKLDAISFDQSSYPAILLTNENYFPALLKAIDEAQSEIFMSIFSFKAGCTRIVILI